MKKFQLFLGALALVVSTSAFAQTVPMADRGITLNKGQGEVGLDFTIGLDKGGAGDKYGIYTGFVADHYSGLSFGYGVIDNLEVGLALDAMRHVPGSTDFGGATIYGKYAFIPNMLGAELGIVLPGKNFADNRLGLDIGVPFQYIAIPGMLKVYVRPDFIIDFSKYHDDFGFTLEADLGAVFNVTPELWLQLGFGIAKLLKPDVGGVALPLGLQVGYTVLPQLDLGLSFNFEDLKGWKADHRNLVIHAAYRF
jgi:hypothetical protein